MTLIEKVARAICVHQGFNPDEPGPQAQGERIQPYWRHVVPIATVAIEAVQKHAEMVGDQAAGIKISDQSLLFPWWMHGMTL